MHTEQDDRLVLLPLIAAPRRSIFVTVCLFLSTLLLLISNSAVEIGYDITECLRRAVHVVAVSLWGFLLCTFFPPSHTHTARDIINAFGRNVKSKETHRLNVGCGRRDDVVCKPHPPTVVVAKYMAQECCSFCAAQDGLLSIDAMHVAAARAEI